MSLADDANLGVTATVLVALTIACLLHIKDYTQNMRYKRAQGWLIPILTLSFCIGWANWVILYDASTCIAVTYVLTFYKSLTFLCFFKYVEALIGWDSTGDLNFFNAEKGITFMVNLGRLKGCCTCCVPRTIETEEIARKYLKRVKIALVQFPIAIFFIMVFGLLLLLSGDLSEKVFAILQLVKIVSTIVAMLNLLNFTLSVARQPEVHRLKLFKQLIWIKLCVILTEAQSLFFIILVYFGVIDSPDSMSLVETTAYINGMFSFYEMIILGFLQFYLFPVSDFFATPQHRYESYYLQKSHQKLREYEEITE